MYLVNDHPNIQEPKNIWKNQMILFDLLFQTKSEA